MISSIFAIYLEYRGQKDIDNKAVHGYEALEGDWEMGALNKDSEGDSFVSDKGDIFRASFAEKMYIKNAPSDLQDKLKHSKN